MNWLIDEKIALTDICENAGWHLATAIEKLEEAGLSNPDAVAFAELCFTDKAEIRDEEPEDVVSKKQWARLSVC